MKHILTLSLVLLAPMTIPAAARTQLSEIGEANLRPIPEIKRLFEAFAGDW